MHRDVGHAARRADHDAVRCRLPSRFLEPDPEQGVDGLGDQGGGVGVVAVDGERGASPGVDGGERCGRVQVVGQGCPDWATTGASAFERRRRAGPPRARRRAARWPAVRQASVQDPVVPVVLAEQGQAGPPSGRRRPPAASRRARGCPATSTSSPRRGRPCRRARRARANGWSVATRASWPHISWCGKTRSEPPPWTSKSVPSRSSAIAVHSMCQPGRPRPTAGPRPARPRAAAARPDSRAASCLPGRSGSPPRSAKVASASASARCDSEPNVRVGGVGEVEVGILRSRRPRRPPPAPRSCVDQLPRPSGSTRQPRCSAPAGARSGPSMSVAEELRSGRRRAAASRPRSRSPARAAGRRRR